jgi:hypothetical protein
LLFGNPCGRSSLALPHKFEINFDIEKKENVKLPKAIRIHPLMTFLRVHMIHFNANRTLVQKEKPTNSLGHPSPSSKLHDSSMRP